MDQLANMQPGNMLKEVFLEPNGISAYRLAREMKVPQTRLSQIIRGKRRITADTALRLATFFGNPPQFWMGMQVDYDLEQEKMKIEDVLKEIKPLQA